MKQTKFEIIRDERAYLIYWVDNGCSVKLDTYYAIYKNLEIIISDSNELLAYRYDHPHDMVNMIGDDGCWRYTDESQLLEPADQLRLKMLCRDYSLN